MSLSHKLFALTLFSDSCFVGRHILNFFFWLLWVFVVLCGLSLIAASGGYSVKVHGFLVAMASLMEQRVGSWLR